MYLPADPWTGQCLLSELQPARDAARLWELPDSVPVKYRCLIGEEFRVSAKSMERGPQRHLVSSLAAQPPHVWKPAAPGERVSRETSVAPTARRKMRLRTEFRDALPFHYPGPVQSSPACCQEVLDRQKSGTSKKSRPARGPLIAVRGTGRGHRGSYPGSLAIAVQDGVHPKSAS